MRPKLQKKAEEAAKTSRATASSILGGIDLEKKVITISRDIFEGLGEGLADSFEQTGLDEWTKKIVGSKDLTDFLKQSLDSLEGLSQDDQIAELTKFQKTVGDYNLAYQQTILTTITDMLADAEGMLEQVGSNKFKNKKPLRSWVIMLQPQIDREKVLVKFQKTPMAHFRLAVS